MKARTLLVLGVLVLVVVFSWGVSVSLAASPWWHLTSGSRPANIKAGVARDEVQKVTVRKGDFEGKFGLGEPIAFEKSEFFNSEGVAQFVELPFTSTAQGVEEGLESFYGLGNIEVSGGPGNELAGEPSEYVVTFKGALADQPAGLDSSFRPLATEGGPLPSGSEATVTEVVRGRPDGEVVVLAENIGDGSVNGAGVPVEFTDVLSGGVRVVGVAATEPTGVSSTSRTPLPCSRKSESVSCVLAGSLAPYAVVEVRVGVVVPGVASGAANEVSVTGGGAQSATITRPLMLSGVPTPFGLERYELTAEAEGGAPVRQAGAHPFQLTTTVGLNQAADAAPLDPRVKPIVTPAALPKDLNFKWPAGLIGNPTLFPRCTLGQFLRLIGDIRDENACPAESAVGVAAVTIFEPVVVGLATFTVPLFNLEPLAGEPARFGFFVPEGNAPVFIDTSVRTGGDYGVTVSSNNITQTAAFLSAAVTVWGVPGDPRHASQRGWGCLYASLGGTGQAPCNKVEGQQPPPFLSLPTSCTSSLQSTVEGDSWTQPGSFQMLASDTLPALDGCNRLPFEPSIKVAPDGTQASTPTGLSVDVHNPQEESLNAAGLAESDVKDITVALPEGVTTNPAGADGLEACSEKQIGFTGVEPGSSRDLFTSGLPAPRGAPAEPFCPDASKIATVKIKTPILPNPLEGSVYLAQQNENPFGSLIAMYLVAEDPVSGVLVKLVGEVALNPETGQIVSRFKDSPQAPFEDAELHFFGGERAPLATPARCGTYTTSASFAPWSGNEPVSASSHFAITSGPHASACPEGALAFTPSFTAGMTSIQAGAFSPLTTTMSREDGNQDLRAITLHMAPGLSGLLSGVKLCGEAEANAGTCGPESEIGETTVSVGLGGDPFSVKGGKVYLTGPYGGAPFGLSVVNPAVAGPFNLGKVIVRAKLEVDPYTAAVTVTTDSSGAYAIPHILDGIPLQIKHVNVTINRPGFTFNPTNCNPLAITATLSSVEGASSLLPVPFQVTNCAVLKFAPKFLISTSGHTSRAGGASLSVKLSYPTAPFGTQANIAKVKVDLPKQLPSRLTTLHEACLAARFEANPASCPAASIVGHAKVITPLLPVPLTGPAYFVSHGGEAFPNLTMVLKGYGVTIELVGSTFIKNGITSSTFKSTPDVPFNTFELTLPEGKFSALAATADLCKSKLAMPTAFVAQNGAEIHQSTKINVTGCPKTRTTTQKLTQALKACRKKKSHATRAACEQQARKHYPAKATKK